MMEMDGAGEGLVARSANSTPFQERLEAVKQTPRSNDMPASVSSDEQQRIEKSMALKNLLNVQSPPPAIRASLQLPIHGNGNAYARSPDPARPDHYAAPQEHAGYRRGDPYQQQQPHMMMMPDPRQVQVRGQPDVKSMEADLRKLLKLS